MNTNILPALEALQDTLLTPDQVAELLGVNPQSIRSAIKDGTFQGLPFIRIGTRTMFPRAAMIDALTKYRR